MKSAFIFCTGDTVTPETRDFIEDSGCPVLNKPFVQKDILEVIAEAGTIRAAQTADQGGVEEKP